MHRRDLIKAGLLTGASVTTGFRAPEPVAADSRRHYELRNYESLKDSYYLQSVTIYANGHDYLSEITDISLLAKQQP